MTPRHQALCSLLCSQYSEAQRKGGLQAVEGSTDFLPLTFADSSAKTLFSATPETRVVCSRRVCSGGHVYPHLRTHLTHPFLPVLISEDKEMATHSSTLAWKIRWTEKPGRLQSMGSQRVGHDWETSLHFLFLARYKFNSPQC